MLRQSTVLTKPIYFTILSCYHPVSVFVVGVSSRAQCLSCGHIHEGFSGDRFLPARRQYTKLRQNPPHHNPTQAQEEPPTYLDHPQLALGYINKLDLLDSHSLAGTPIEGLVHGPKGPLANTVAEAL